MSLDQERIPALILLPPRMPIRRRTLLIGVIAFVSMLAVALEIRFVALPANFLGFTGAWVALVMLPGLLVIVALDLKVHSFPEHVGLAAILGLSLLIVLALMAQSVGLDLAGLSWLSASALLVLVAASAWRLWLQVSDSRVMTDPRPWSATRRRSSLIALFYWLGLALALIVMGYLAYKAPEPFSLRDRISYQAAIRRFLDSGTPFASTWPLSFTNSDNARWTYVPWLISLAEVIKVGGGDLLSIYLHLMPPLLAGTSLLITFGLAYEVCRSRFAAAAAVLIQSLFLATSVGVRDGTGYTFLLRLVEDKFVVAFLLAPAAWWLTLRYLRRGRIREIATLAIVLLASAFLHPLGMMEYGILAGPSVLLLVLGQGKRLRRAWIRRIWIRRLIPLAVLCGLLLVPPFLQRQHKFAQSSPAVAAESASTVEASPASFRWRLAENSALRQRHLQVLSVESKLYQVPAPYVEHPLQVLTFVLALPLLFYRRRRIGARFLAGGVIGVTLATLVPGFTAIVGQFTTPWLLWRLVMVLPVGAVIAFWLFELTDVVSRRYVAAVRLGPAAPLAILMAAALVLAPAAAPDWQQFRDWSASALKAGPDELFLLQLLRAQSSPAVLSLSSPMWIHRR